MPEPLLTPAEIAEQWSQALLRMDFDDPGLRSAMELEGVRISLRNLRSAAPHSYRTRQCSGAAAFTTMR